MEVEKNKVLFELVKNHKWEEFLLYLKKNEDIDLNIRDENNNYIITYIILFNKPEITSKLIEMGSRIDIIDNDERSILYIPIKYNYKSIIEILIKYDQKVIGETIQDIRDRNGNISLHYAIGLKNEYATKLLLDNGSDANKKDNSGLNSLHLSVHTRDITFCRIILKNISNINDQNNSGDTSLSIACNFELYDIINFLLDNNADPNIQDYAHEITPLIYSVNLNNPNITKILLKNGADPNIQDIYGNSALHYCITENNTILFNILVNEEYSKIYINLNNYNLDGKIPLHLVFDQDTINNMYIKYLIKGSDINLQDNNNNSCLHHIIRTQLWKEYKSQLIQKKLNIYLKNKDGKMPIDYIKKNDMDMFMDMVTDSYLNQLRNLTNIWKEDWENICDKKIVFDQLTVEEKKLLGKYINVSNTSETSGNDICRKIIKKKLNRLNKLTCVECKDKSYPIKKGTVCLDIDEGTSIKFCTYTGITLDVLIGLIYLLKKYPILCSTLSSDFIQNNQLCNHYKSIGMPMGGNCEFMNFEIVWSHFKLYLSDNFNIMFSKCLNNKSKKFIVIPLGIELKKGNHANYLIYDIKKNELERFEPHGANSPYNFNYKSELLDNLLKNKFNKLVTNIKYISPKDYLPKIGFQLFDSSESNCKKIGDPRGFCALWAMWYVDMRIKYKEIDRKILVSNMIISIKQKNISFKDMIRNYSKDIIEMRDMLLSKANIDINDWLNEQYNNDQLSTIIKEIKKSISSIQ